MKRDKVIMTCAITDSIHTPSISPYLPITPDQITAEALAAAEAGAAMIHLHARHPEDGRPDQSPGRFREFMPQIKVGTDAILNVTTGAGLGWRRPCQPFATLSAVTGGNVRVGLEDSLLIGRGQQAVSNAEQVAKIRRIFEELGLDIASPPEARAMLGTKGGQDVGF